MKKEIVEKIANKFKKKKILVNYMLKECVSLNYTLSESKINIENYFMSYTCPKLVQH